jgi:hypothetical protein
VDVGEKIRPPVVHEGVLYFGLKSGAITILDLKNGRLGKLVEDIGRLAARPVCSDGVLYIGTMKRSLRAYRLEDGRLLWEQNFAKSISVSVALGNGLVFAATHEGLLYALDASSGEVVWCFPVSPKKPLFASPLYDDGTVYIGSEEGSVFALPWHLGKYAWAAGWLEKQEQFTEAGILYAAAGDHEQSEMQARADFYEAAMRCWRRAGQRPWAASLRASMLGEAPQAIAAEYEEAGKLLKTRQPDQAAELLRRAAEWYEEAEETDRAWACSSMAARAAHAPYLTIKAVNFPDDWEAGEEQMVVFEFSNRGNAAAQKVWLRLAGNLQARLWVEFSSLSPGTVPVELEAPIIPVSSGNLVVDVRYQDARGKNWTKSKSFPMSVKPSTTMIEIDGDVGSLKLDELEGKVKVHGDVGELKVQARPPSAGDSTQGPA